MFAHFSQVAADNESLKIEQKVDHLWSQALVIEDADDNKVKLKNGTIITIDPREKLFFSLFEAEVSKLVNESSISTMDSKTLHKLYMVLNKISFYSQSKKVTNSFRDFVELTEGKVEYHYIFVRSLVESLIAQWSFQDAVHISSVLPELIELKLPKLEELVSYNENSNIQYQYVYDTNLWADIGYWNTPTLYFFNESGDLLKQIVGWPEAGNKDEVLEAMHLIGLL